VLVFAEAADCWETWKIALKEWNMIESKQVKEWQDQARREGRQEGRQEGQRQRSFEDLIDVLHEKFGNLPTEIPSHLQTIDDANVLRQLLRKAVHASNLDEFRSMIPNGTK
jgi:flagellar biosynthesis/type III secretory pathway protein FliH